MKKIIALLLLVSFFSCEKDESLNPLPTIVNGQYVTLDITKKALAFEHLDQAVFGGTLRTPGNNVVKYDLYVRYTNADGVTANNYVLLKSITSFPHELEVTPQELVTALNISLDDLSENDRFRFLGYSYDANGNVADYNNLSATVKTQLGMKQGYKFTTKLLDDAAIALDDLNNYEL